MKIIESDIYDVTPSTLDEDKVTIANNILNMVGPMFTTELTESSKSLEKVHKKKIQIEKQLQETKEKLKTLQVEFGREVKRKKLLNRIRQLMEVGLTAEPSLKSEIIILLKVIDKLEDSLLDEHIERMVKSISKRFSKNF
jgi:predicted  nucleic acid-binding Zn-ribbon protein